MMRVCEECGSDDLDVVAEFGMVQCQACRAFFSDDDESPSQESSRRNRERLDREW